MGCGGDDVNELLGQPRRSFQNNVSPATLRACWTQGSVRKPFGEVFFFKKGDEKKKKKGDDYLLHVGYKNVLWGMVFITRTELCPKSFH